MKQKPWEVNVNLQIVMTILFQLHEDLIDLNGCPIRSFTKQAKNCNRSVVSDVTNYAIRLFSIT